jgi:hypothetical protein
MHEPWEPQSAIGSTAQQRSARTDEQVEQDDGQQQVHHEENGDSSAWKRFIQVIVTGSESLQRAQSSTGRANTTDDAGSDRQAGEILHDGTGTKTQV